VTPNTGSRLLRDDVEIGKFLADAMKKVGNFYGLG